MATIIASTSWLFCLWILSNIKFLYQKMTLISQNNRRAGKYIYMCLSRRSKIHRHSNTGPSPFSEVHVWCTHLFRTASSHPNYYFISKIHVFMLLPFRMTSSYPNYYFIWKKYFVFKMLLFKNFAHIRLIWNLVWFGWFMVCNATFNNISVISWQSVLFVGWNQNTCRKPLTCRKSLTKFIP
jgi:hypothetical protein